MASAGLLALLDDIATLLDDVSVYSKVAAKNTAGVLGDDLALNAQQVTGVGAKRELPVVWAVAKGSFLNKLIIVPAALLISAFLPWLITPLLMLGGLFLCFEGAEKIAHKWLHSAEEDEAHEKELREAAGQGGKAMKQAERDQIRGAIRTDFILSAEIIVIALGAASDAGIWTQTVVVSLVALVATVGVYGLVAGIVRFDDWGLALLKGAGADAWGRFRQALGRGILAAAPRFMRGLSIVGMVAMFLVGGGILVHGLPFLHHLVEAVTHGLGAVSQWLVPMLINGAVGLVAGAIVLAGVTGFQRARKAL
ncbi:MULTISPECIES: DUF808 domain-containing protein [unclassified Guyparkeria]|uniref:DUF808 domain-containing protein n=1 Tax=unclassified Guyparkeria TaxID=2626246 RepID=UPI0007337899|nr:MULTISPECIES: DUF808 domain-containing protein [unclassified Guyparkeria]KTG17541.1 hypothetical protein AUR63_07755 [Guyparkeria sp. XI15]OAE88356.1 hypothetical protein AWR35_07770 [Guyparkeria sp. WRN-7]